MLPSPPPINSRLEAMVEVVTESCDLLLRDRAAAARELIKTLYPLESAPVPPCNYSGERLQEPIQERRSPRRRSPIDVAMVFARDGYIDRYTGNRVIDPIVLRLLGDEQCGPLQAELPYHTNGGRGQPSRGKEKKVCHQAGYELFASYEHVRPISVGGLDDIENLVTAAYDTNKEKGTQTWLPSAPPGRLQDWDGLTGWLLEFTETHEFTGPSDLKAWRSAIQRARTAVLTEE